MRKELIALAFVLVFISFASATTFQVISLPTQTLNQSVNIIQNCNCTTANVTNIILANNSILTVNGIMNATGTVFNYTLSSQYISSLGTYQVNGVANLDGSNQPWSYTFNVTPNGDNLDSANSILFFIFMFLSLILTGFFIFMFKKTLWGNPKDNSGAIMGISYKKYGKIAFFYLAYLSLLLFFTFGDEFTKLYFWQIPIINTFFDIPFFILIVASGPLLIITFAFAFLSIINDRKIHKILKWEKTY